MKTTLTLDKDVAEALEARAVREGVPFKQMVNDLLRGAIQASGRRCGDQVPPQSYDPEVSLNQLYDELETENDVAEMREENEEWLRRQQAREK